jgi:hypothetical protein
VLVIGAEAGARATGDVVILGPLPDNPGKPYGGWRCGGKEADMPSRPVASGSSEVATLTVCLSAVSHRVWWPLKECGNEVDEADALQRRLVGAYR